MSFNETTEAEALAESVMNVTDWQKMEAEGLSARQYLEREHGVDVDDHNSESGLRAAVLSARKKNGDPDNKAGESSTDDEPEIDESDQITASVGADQRFRYGDSEEEISALSHAVMTVSDLRSMEAEGLSARETIHERHGVDPREHRTEASLRQAIEEADR